MSNFASANMELPSLGLRDWRASALTEVTIALLEDSLTSKIFAATREFVTHAADDPRLTPFLGTLLKTINLTQSIVGSFGFGDFSQTWGDIELSNFEADYDIFVRDFASAGRAVILKAGQLDADGTVPAYSEFVTIATLVAERWSATRDVLRVAVREASQLEVTAQPAIYGGTGNLDGSADLAGKRKPWAFGSVNNITPALLIANELVYAVSWRAVQGIDAVYDGGFALTSAGNVATSTLMRNATIVAGQYVTCNAEGLFRIGASPDKQITCSVRGDSAGTGGYVTMTADVVRTIVSTAGGFAWTGGFDGAAFSHVNTIQPAAIAFYLEPGGELTVLDVAGKLMKGIGGWGAVDRNGRFTVDRFEEPGIAAAATYDSTYMIDFDREDGIAGLSSPPRRIRCAYDRNWTVQTDVHAVVGDLDPTRLAYLSQPFRIASTSEAAASERVNDWPNATDPDVVESYFVAEADALAEAARLLDLYDGLRTSYRFKVANRVFAHRVNHTIRMIYPRFGLDDGKPMRIVELSEDPDVNETQILAYG